MRIEENFRCMCGNIQSWTLDQRSCSSCSRLTEAWELIMLESWFNTWTILLTKNFRLMQSYSLVKLTNQLKVDENWRSNTIINSRPLMTSFDWALIKKNNGCERCLMKTKSLWNIYNIIYIYIFIFSRNETKRKHEQESSSMVNF